MNAKLKWAADCRHVCVNISPVTRRGTGLHRVGLLKQKDSSSPLAWGKFQATRPPQFFLVFIASAPGERQCEPALLWCGDWPARHSRKNGFYLRDGRNKFEREFNVAFMSG
jgi:hypothetical protein